MIYKTTFTSLKLNNFFYEPGGRTPNKQQPTQAKQFNLVKEIKIWYKKDKKEKKGRGLDKNHKIDQSKKTQS